jgi:site-specific recombinase XerD
MGDQRGVMSTGPFEELVEQYRRWLTFERCLSAGRIEAYVREARRFLRERQGRELRGLTLDEVTGYVVQGCRRRRSGSARDLVTGLRSLLGYLYLEGITDRQLAPAVPTPAAWRGTWLPKGLTAEELAALLAAFDASTVIGRRDYAVVVMLARLGLRAGEVCALTLDDLDWAQGEIVVHGNKANRTERLPLPVDVGEAIVAYLRDGRPKTACRAVFVRTNGAGGLSAAGVWGVVKRAVVRAGLASGSAHRLRHSAGTAMLRAGASLAEVGQVLRQRSSQVTAHYAKVDFAALRAVALPWPERVA